MGRNHFMGTGCSVRGGSWCIYRTMALVSSLTSDELTSPNPDPWMGYPSHCSSVAIFMLTQKHTSYLKYEPRSLGSNYSKYQVPMWYQFLRVFILTEQRKVISAYFKCVLGNIRKAGHRTAGKPLEHADRLSDDILPLGWWNLVVSTFQKDLPNGLSYGEPRDKQ